MDKATFLEKIKEIGTCEDDVTRRSLLADIEEVTKIYDENEILKTEKENLKNTNEQYEKDNETLRQANMKLFLRVGEDKTEKQKTEDTTGIQQPDESKRKFEDLFNEKGGLK